MFIKAVKTYTAKNGQPQRSCRLVENYRVKDKVRQRTLLNLGSQWPVHNKLWPAVAQRVQEKLDGQSQLWDGSLQVEREADDIVRRLRARGWPQLDSRTDAVAEIYLDSLEHEEPRSVGGERMCLDALEQLEWFELLQSLGVTERDAKLCAALLIARMLHPSSEREALRWMLEDSAILELLELDQGLPPSLSKLYRLNDLLWKHRNALQQGLCQRERELLNIPAAVLFYDLTNVHYHGRHNGSLVCFGRSKQKRSDCPLISLALAIDRAGFPCYSEILPGNISEPKTLKKMLTRLQTQHQAAPRPTVIMDAGIATKENLKWLKKQGYHWLSVSRGAKPSAPQSAPDVTLVTSSQAQVNAWKLEGDEREVKVYLHSENKHHGDVSILEKKRQRFEQELQRLHEGLSKPRYLKRLSKVHQKIGRIRQKYPKVSPHYRVEVEASDDGINAAAVRFDRKPNYEQADEQAGSYILRSSHVDWSAEKIARSYWQLTEIEATFRSLKSELGLRPIWHQLEHRISAHLLISVLAYHPVQLLRTRLKAQGIDLCWNSIRTRMRSWVRITTTLKEVSGELIINRQNSRPSAAVMEIAKALNMKIRLQRHRIRSPQ